VTAADTARAAARAQLERLKADPQWFQRLMGGDAEATADAGAGRLRPRCPR